MALKRIALRDFVIVQALELDFHAGFTVLTGETGAGKSILIDALQLVLGSRADAGVVREGAAQTDITAEFDCPPQLGNWLEEGGFSPEDSLLLRRVIDSQGRSRAWINGAPATATQLRHLGDAALERRRIAQRHCCDQRYIGAAPLGHRIADDRENRRSRNDEQQGRCCDKGKPQFDRHGGSWWQRGKGGMGRESRAGYWRLCW